MRTFLRNGFLALLPMLALLAGSHFSWLLVARWHGDVLIYARYAEQVMQGALPYRDFTLEYPPLALVPFVLPRLLVLGGELDAEQYRTLFLLQSALYVWLISLVALALAERRRGQVTLWMTVLVSVLSPFLPWRFDLFPALLTALAVLAAVRVRAGASGVWLGLGVAAKLYPLVVGPLLGVYVFTAGRAAAPTNTQPVAVWHPLALLRYCLGGAMALAATVLPFFLLAPVGLLGFLEYHEQRGLQIESVAGGAVLLGRLLGLTEASMDFNYGAFHLASPWADALLPILTPLLIVLYGLLMILAWRALRLRTNRLGLGATGGERVHRLIALVCAALLLFITTSKVFSPQYLVWLLPFAPLLRPRQIALFAGICTATVAIFPFGYDALLALERWAVLLLNARNAATVLLLVWLVMDTVRVAR